MTPATQQPRALLPEFPRVLTSKTDPLYRMVASVCEKMTTLDVSRHGQVLGLYGGRGTGKTSALLTLLAILHDKNRQRGDLAKSDRDKTIQWLAPHSTSEHNGDLILIPPRQLFAPEFSRTGDDLLFMLLAYLEKWYQPEFRDSNHRSTRPGKGTPRAKIQHSEVRRRMPKEFFSFERDASVSSQELPRRLVRSQVRVAQSTEHMIGWFRELFVKLTEGNTRFVLLVDDLDLQPQRALELLELIHLFVLQPNVIVVLAADQDLLIHSVAASLSKRDDGPLTAASSKLTHYQRLARAMLQKWVPTEFSLPRPELSERWRFPVPSSTLGACLVDDFWGSARERFGDDLARQAEDVLAPILPDTYRGLVQLYNRLALIEATPADQKGGRWNLTPSMVAPFRSLVLCSGVSNPELGLPGLAEDLESDFAQELAVSASGTDPAEESNPTGEQTQRPQIADSTSLSAQAPLMSEPLRAMSERERRRAQRHLAAVAEGWKTLSEAIQWHFLAISLNADMWQHGQAIWNNPRFGGRVHHLDLREFATGGRATPDDLRKARETCQTAIVDMVPKDTHQEVFVLAKVQLPLFLWIGHRLRYWRHVSLYLDRGVKFDPISNPEGTILRPEKKRAYQWIRPVSEVSTTAPDANSAKEAVVILDFLGRSQPGQLDKFHGPDGTPVTPTIKTRLLPAGSVSPLVSAQQLREILTDVLQYFYELQDDGVSRIHVGLACPDVLAFFLGQQLNAWTLCLYEYYSDKGEYEYVFDL